jgi:hypothetical protein
MTTKLENNTISRLGSLESQDFNKEVNSVNSNSLCPHMIDSGNHKDGCKQKPTNLQNKHNSICPLPSVKNTTPHGEVTMQFAAKQLFQILLVNVKYIHSKSVSDLDLLDVPIESNPLII